MIYIMNYYGGSHARGSSNVRLLEADTFAELVERYFNTPHSFNMTRAEFLSRTPDEQNEFKDGPFYCSCRYPDGTTARTSDVQPEKLNMVVLDLDKGDFIKCFMEEPETIGEALAPYNFVAHETARSTPESPRLKITIDLAPCHPSRLPALVRFLARRMGIPEGGYDPVSMVAKQIHYRPIKFKGEAHTSVLASRTNGQAMSYKDIPAEELDADPDIPADAPSSYAYEGDITLDLAHLPVLELTVEDIREPLYAIDPDCGYKQWTEIACGLRHQFTTEEDAFAAYTLFDEWSSTGTKYRSDKETLLKWRSFRPYTPNRCPVTIRSLFKHAGDAGWKHAKLSVKTQQSLTDWIEACDSPQELLEHGCGLIAGMPFSSEVNEELLLAKLRARYKAITGDTIDKITLRKQMASTRHRARTENASEELPAWLRPMVFVIPDNIFRNTGTNVVITPDGFNNAYSEQLMPKADDKELAASGRPSILPVHYALNVARIPRVDGLIYDPRQQGAEPIFKSNGCTYLNTYRTDSIPVLDAARSEEAGAIFTEHIGKLVKEAVCQRLLIDYLCHLVQHPGVKIRWAAIIQSAEGAGKGMLHDILKAAMGEGNTKAITSNIMQSQWTDWMVGAVLIVLEEIHISGTNRLAVMNNLKQAISDDNITINKRNTSAAVFPNTANLIGFTNHHHALHVSDSDRRLCLMESMLQTKEQIVRLNATGHFTRSATLLTMPGALRHWMLHHPIDPAFPVNGPAPETRYRQAAVEASKNRLQKVIEDYIDDDARTLVGADVIHYTYLSESAAHETRNGTSCDTFLHPLGYEPYCGGKRFTIGGQRTEIWVHRENYDPDFEPAEQLLEERNSRLNL